MCKPVRHIGMGIDDPMFNAPFGFHSSQHSTNMLVEAIKTGSKINFDKYEEENRAVKQQCRTTKEKKFQEEVAEILSLLPQQ